MGGDLNPFSELERFCERVSPANIEKAAKSATGFFRDLKAKGAYGRALRDYDAETAEAVAAAVRAGRDPRAILERANRQKHERAERERLLASPPPLHGSARWAAVSDLGPLLRGREAFDDPRSILLGGIADDRDRVAGFLHWDDDGHLLTLAPTRTGKAVTTIIPNLLRYGGSAIVLDPKGELYEKTSRWRRTLGPVYRIDAFDDGSNPWRAGWPRHGYNPIANVKTFAEARALATVMFPRDPRGQDFFIDDVLAFFAPLIWFLVQRAPPDRRNIGTICTMLSTDEATFRDQVLGVMAGSGIPEVQAGAAAVLKKFGRQGSSSTPLGTFFDTLNSKLGLWRDPQVIAATDPDDVRFDRLKDETATVYLVVPFELMEPYRDYLKVVLQGALDGMRRNPRIPEIPVLFVLDEFLQLGPSPEFRNAIRTHAGYGVRLWFFLQDIGTLQEHYPGTSWQTFFNCAVKQFFGTDETFTAELVSRFLGTTTVAYRATNEGSNVSAQMGGENGSAGVNMSSGESIQFLGRSLLTPDEVLAELSGWLRGGQRNSFVRLRVPGHPVRARLTSFEQSETFLRRLGAHTKPAA